MHYEEYNNLFREGLSTRMRKDMMDHLRPAMCLSAYLTAMEPQVEMQNVIEENQTCSKIFHNQPRVLWRPVGLIAIALAVLPVLFTPQGNSLGSDSSSLRIGILFCSGLAWKKILRMFRKSTNQRFMILKSPC